MTVRKTQSITTVRHATTAHNAAHIISGTLDEPLSNEGEALAHRFVAKFGHLRADLVIASPLRRALRTATILTGLVASQVLLDPLCAERDYGLLQGLMAADVARYAASITYLRVGGIDHSLNPPGGETFEALRDRASRFLAAVRGLPAQSVLVVSHQVFLQQLHGILRGLDVQDALAVDIRTLQIDRFDVDPDGVNHVTEFEGMGTATSW